MKRLVIVALTLAVLGAGCGKPDRGSSGADSSAEPSAAGQPPTEVDFEEEADAQIDASNMETELSALEKEIAADSE